MTQGRALTAESRARFLELLAQTANVTASAASIDAHRNTAYGWRERDPDFARDWDAAIEMATDSLQSEARRRAFEGVVEPLVSQGKLVKDDAGQVVTITRYSDKLMELLLRAHRPDMFRDRTETRHVGADGGPVLIAAVRSRIEQRLGALADTAAALIAAARPAPVVLEAVAEPAPVALEADPESRWPQSRSASD